MTTGLVREGREGRETEIGREGESERGEELRRGGRRGASRGGSRRRLLGRRVRSSELEASSSAVSRRAAGIRQASMCR